MTRVRVCLLAGLVTVTMTACGSANRSAGPTWQPSPGFSGEGPGVQVSPIIPVPSLGEGRNGQQPGGNGRSSGNGPGGGSGGNSGAPSKGRKIDPLVVAKHLKSPTGLTMLPDNTALVGERTTGRIVRVQPKPGLPVPTVRVLPGLDTSGGGGLLDLALSPTYAQDNLIYAYITTRTDNRVVDFTLHGPVTPVFTGIPKGRSDNTGRIMFDTVHRLYIGTGDAGHANLAQKPSSRAGKVLRVSDIGGTVAGNPHAGSPVWTSGHRVVNGLCVGPTGTIVDVESDGPSQSTARDEINLLAAGADYGWPRPTSSSRTPLATLPSGERSPGGCAIANGTLYVTSLDGHSLLSARILGNGRRTHLDEFQKALTNRYGRLRTVVAAQDGALWLTTSNRDGKGQPVADDERVIRYISPSGGGGSNPV